MNNPQRMREKAIWIARQVQGTMLLEGHGLDDRSFEELVRYGIKRLVEHAEGKGTQLSVPGNPSHPHQPGEQEASSPVEGISDTTADR